MHPRGLIVDWLELYKGESVQVVYALLLQVIKAFKESGCEAKVAFYDNACKLLAVARRLSSAYQPWTGLASKVRYLLDGFHRDNHTWCLSHMPDVDPERPENLHLSENVNTQACEQYNSWINSHTLPACEMTEGHFHIYWWAMFHEHNKWLLMCAGGD